MASSSLIPLLVSHFVILVIGSCFRFIRFASAFSRPPGKVCQRVLPPTGLGARRLCTPFYVKVFQHCSLNLEKFPEEPKTPINPSANSEINYLETILAKVGGK